MCQRETESETGWLRNREKDRARKKSETENKDMKEEENVYD